MRFIIGTFIFILIVSGFACGFYFHKEAYRARKALDQERYMRINMEEALQEQRKQVSSLETAIERLEIKLKTTEQLVERKKVLNKDLQIQLEQALIIQQNLKATIKRQEEELKRLKGVVTTSKRPNPLVEK